MVKMIDLKEDSDFLAYSDLSDKMKEAVTAIADGKPLGVVVNSLVPVLAFLLLHYEDAEVCAKNTEELCNTLKEVVRVGAKALQNPDGFAKGMH